MSILVKLRDARNVLANEFDGKGKCARRINVIVTKYLVVGRAGLQHVSLKGNLNRNGLFVVHDAILLQGVAVSVGAHSRD